MRRYLLTVLAVLFGAATLAAAVATFVQWYIAIFSAGVRQATYAHSGWLTLFVTAVLAICTATAAYWASQS